MIIGRADVSQWTFNDRKSANMSHTKLNERPSTFL